jgi:predicted nucleic-acid-binding protein
MRAVDTNVLVRLLARDHPAQVAAAEAFVQAGAWVSHIVLVESIWVLDSVYELPSDKIALGVEMLLDHDNLVVQDADVVRAALSTFRKRPALGFSDCLIVEVARKAGHVPVGTFDRRLARLPDTQKLG